MSDFGRPRGLGRGLSALLGEPVRTEPRPEPRPEPAPPRPSPVTLVEPPAPEPPVSIESLLAPEPAPSPAPQPPAAPQDGVRLLALDKIDRNPAQPRRIFDEAELAELSASIRAHGVLQPILVRPGGVPGRFEIVAGERRWRAAQMAEIATIPALVRDMDDRDALEIAIVENVQRTDLNPIEEALGYQALIDRFGRTQQEIADQVGKSRPHIANLLRLLTLPEEIQDMVKDGSLSAGHAKAIIGAPDMLALAKLAVAAGMTVREVEKRAQIAKDKTPEAAEKPAKDPDLKALEEMLARTLSLAVSITAKGDGAGELRIAYKEAAQLDDLCRRLSGGAGS